ncbi:MAG: EAL domain-containing protein [Pseudomonadota bacterium]
MLQKVNTNPLDRDHFQIADLMTRSVAEVDTGMSLAEAAERMWSARIGSLVVTENGRLAGIITEHDILAVLRKAVSPATPVGEIASHEVVSCAPHTPAATAHALMASTGVRHLLVLADGGQVLGIASLTDFRDNRAVASIDPLTPVADLMRGEVPMLGPHDGLAAALDAMHEQLSSCVLVVDAGRHPVGMLTVRDSVRLFGAGAAPGVVLLESVMSRPVLRVRRNDALDDAVRMMQANRVRHLAVVDAEDRALGVIFETEVVRHLEMARHHTIDRLKLAASVYDHSHEGIIITDPAGIVIDVNAAFERITGYRYDEVVGRRAGEPIRSGQHGPEFYREMWHALGTTGLWRGEIINRRRNGELLVEMLTISAVRDSNGAVSHYVGVFTDITELRKSQDRLAFLNHYDPLTRLPNRTLLIDRMQSALERVRGSGRLAAVAYLDLDGFGAINEAVGHEQGDLILIELAGRLTHALRPGDTVARLGSDEFVLLLADLMRPIEAERAIEHVLASLGQPIGDMPATLPLSASIGMSFAPADGLDADALIRNANHAMLSAKRAGGNCLNLFDADQEHRSRTAREMLGRLRQALAQGELELHYQPQVNLRQGSITGAEALLRWRDPQRGLVPPGEFLPHVEESDFMATLGDWVLEAALRQIEDWLAQGLRLKVSVNVAAQQLLQPDFIDRLRALLARHPQVPSELLGLEILETVVLGDVERVTGIIRAADELGIGFALDDFGTGYASLSHFRDLPVHILKIDQGFVRGMLDDPGNLAIIEAVIGLTAAFQRLVVAEGVETEEHGLLLLRLGCNVMQGYAYGRPMPATEFRRWCAAFRPDPAWTQVCEEHIPREEFPLLAAEIHHRRWVERFLRVGAGEALELDHGDIDDEQRCAFGHWMFGAGQMRFGHLPAYREIVATHHRVHVVGVELLDHHRAGRLAAYRAGLPRLEELRDKLVSQLRAVRTATFHADGGRVAALRRTA